MLFGVCCVGAQIISVKCLRSQHTPVSAAVPSLASSWAAVATNSQHIRLLHLETFDADLLTGHTDLVLSLDVSPCGRYVVSSAKDHTVRMWDVSTLHASADASAAAAIGRTSAGGALECLLVGTGHSDAVASVAFCKKSALPDAQRSGPAAAYFFVSGSKDRTLKRWDVAALLSRCACLVLFLCSHPSAFVPLIC